MGFAPTGSGYRSIPGRWAAAGNWAIATLTTALAGVQNDLTFTSRAARHQQESGNAVRVRYVVAGASTPLTVAVAGNDITVNVATSSGSVATSTAAQVRDAVNASVPASALVTAALATGNDGTGVVAALAYTNLTGGSDWVIGTRR